MINLRKISKCFHKNVVLKDINLDLPNKGLVVIKGENGSGKSTLLNIIGLMDDRYEGKLLYDEKDMKTLSSSEKAKFRTSFISYCFQKNNLISYFNVDENKNLDLILDREDFAEKNTQKTSNLSQGQQQLIVLNHILKPGKKVYLLDEITGCLDKENTRIVLNQVQKLSEDALVILVSHVNDFSEIASIVLHLEKGKIKFEKNVIIEDNPLCFEEPKKIAKLSPKIFFKSTKKNALIHLFSLIILAFVSCISSMGIISTTITPREALGNVLDKALFVEAWASYGDKKLNEVFPKDAFYYDYARIIKKHDEDNPVTYKSISYKSVIYSDKVDEEYAYINDDFFNELKNRFKIESIEDITLENFNLDLKIDNSLITAQFYVSSNYLITEQKPLFYGGGFWDTNEHPARYYNNAAASLAVYGYASYINRQYATEVLNLDIPNDLKDDTLYIMDNRLVNDNIAYFQKYYSALERPAGLDLSAAFPDGVRVELLKLDYYPPLPPYEAVYNYVIVSDASYQKISEVFMDTERGFLIDLSSNRKAIMNYITNNKIRVYTYDYDGLTEKQKNIAENRIHSYHMVIDSKLEVMNSFMTAWMAYGMSFVTILLSVMIGYFINNSQKKNNMVLKSKGLSTPKRFILTNGFSLIVLTIAFFAGYLVTVITDQYTNTYNYIPGFNFFGILFLIVMVTCTFFADLLFFRRSERK